MDREELVDAMAEAAWGPYGGLRSLTQQQRETALADMKRALAVAEPVVRADERHTIEAAFSHANDWGAEEHDRIIAAIRAGGANAG